VPDGVRFSHFTENGPKSVSSVSENALLVPEFREQPDWFELIEMQQ